MCGRFANNLEELYGWAEFLSGLPKDGMIGYNVAPTQNVPLITGEGGKVMRWGLIPPWSKEPKSKFATFNARAESVDHKPAFKHAWQQSQTCCFPVLGYYEWKSLNGSKQPYFIKSKTGEPIVMAGLWEYWNRGNNALYSATIITEEALGDLADLHHRKPILLDTDQAKSWLYDGISIFSDLQANQKTENIEYYPINTLVNKVSNQGAVLTEPI